MGTTQKKFLIDHVSGLNKSSPFNSQSFDKRKLDKCVKPGFVGEVTLNWPLRPELSISERTDRV